MKATYIQDTPEFGRGVYANKPLFKGDVVMTCEILLLSSTDTKIINDLTDLKFYTFKYSDNNDCLVLGDGEIFNHASTQVFNVFENESPAYNEQIHNNTTKILTARGQDFANVKYELEDFFGRKRMVFTALTDIAEQAQLFIDYGTDTNVEIDGYVNSKSLIG
jgi:SET domain-containing protein